MTPTWKPLAPSVSDDDPLPTFLISATFTPKSYTIHLTDLTYIWRESLSSTSIIERSHEEGTVIELEEGEDDNLRVFLQKIEGALEGQEGTTLELEVDAVRRGPPALSLNVTAEVKGLGTLEWPIRLAVVSQSVLTTEMVVPLMQTVCVRRSEVAVLVDALKEKDHVIQKLVDKLEAQGTDLGQVFPGAAGKGGRKVTRVWAEERVKGLRTFATDVWQNGRPARAARDTQELLANVFGGDNSSKKLEPAPVQPGHQDNWWEGRNDSPILLTYDTSKQHTPDLKIKTDPKSRKRDTLEDKDDFQVQTTPPGKRSANKNMIDSTEDDEDLDVPSQAVPDSFPSPAPPQAKLKPTKIGGLRGKTAPKARSPGLDNSEQDTKTEDVYRLPPPKKTTPPKKKPAALIVESSTETESEPSPPPKRKKSFSPEVPKSKQKAKQKNDPETEDEEDFPPAPPNMKVQKAKPKDDSATEGEDSSSPALPKSKRQKMKLGSQVGTRQKGASDTEDEVTSPPASSTTKRQKTQLGSFAEKRQIVTSETDEDDTPPPPPKKATPRRAAASSPEPAKPKKGRLGGLKKAAAILPPPSDSDTDSELGVSLPSRPTVAPGKTKLGGLRGKATAGTASQDDQENAVPRKLGGPRNKSQTPEKDDDIPGSRGRAAQKKETPPPSETPIERANKKREQLKRDLAAKANAPAKKKRRF